MRILKAESIRLSEHEAVEKGIVSYKDLMFAAGTAVGKEILSKFDVQNKRIAVICGNGNNGGDGFVTARFLYDYGASVSVFIPLGEPKTDNSALYFGYVKSLVKPDFDGNYDIIIDAVFGTGLNRELPENISKLFKKINPQSCFKVAVDVPSGVETDTGRVFGTCFDADLTVTFIAPKPCFYLPEGSDYCGQIAVADIGVAPIGDGYEINETPVFKKRRHNSHKGSNKTALLLCGSYGMAGAAMLSAKAAVRSGLGIAKCVVCESIYPAFTSYIPEAVCIPAKQTEDGCLRADSVSIKELTKDCSALLFGPGIKACEDTGRILENIFSESEIPIVLDADGINLLCDRIYLLRKSKVPVIITPHPGEMARLLGVTVKDVEADRVNIAKKFATENNCTVVLKGADTVIASNKGGIVFNINGNPGMAKGGSGDILAGITVSLLAQGYEPYTAAKAAVYVHGLAGDLAKEKYGEISMLPSDLLKELNKAFR